MSTSVEGSYLIGTCVSAILFGIYTTVFIQVFLNLLGNRERHAVVIAAIVFMYIGSSIALGFQVTGVYRGFIVYRENPGPYQYFMGDYKKQVTAPNHLMLLLNGILGDCFLCWRLYVIWNRSKMVLIAPIMLLLGMIVTGTISVTEGFTHGIRGPEEPFYIWTILVFSFTTVLNVLVTGLICWQILGVSRAVANSLPSRSSGYSRLIHALIDSCGIYTVAALLFLIFKLVKQYEASVITSHALSVLVGLVPTLIFLRLQLQARKARHTSSSSRSRTLGGSGGGVHGVDGGGRVFSTIRFAHPPGDELSTVPGATTVSPSEDYEISLDSMGKEDDKEVDVKRLSSV
ncbi:hypothetical protein FRC03_008444 [Tulasnella sp. 419]|nr:hypothetical protein FRC02_008303 [Tulasnella sp. 418]KAG8959104.1 hypothetical protein FRC03_008444 [Tulasnella sp. 419]